MTGEGAFKPHRRHKVGEPLVRLEPPRVHSSARATGGLRGIHQRWREGRRREDEDLWRFTDDDGIFVPQSGMPLLAERFRYVELIGEGQSSVLIKAEDTFRENELVSIKILHVSYKILGTQECDVLRELNSKDPGDLAHILRLRTIFSFNDHFCMVIEILHPQPLYEYFIGEAREMLSELKALSLIRCVANRLLQTLGFLNWQNVIHADLKPENILLKHDGDFSTVKLVDFGNAIHCVYAEVSLYYDDFELQTLLYRAPEVMFGVPFGTEVDLWSLGCILAEFFKGEPIFYGQNREEILEKMIVVLGPFPHEVFKCGKFFPELIHYTSAPIATSAGAANPSDVTLPTQPTNGEVFGAGMPTYPPEQIKDNLRHLLRTSDALFVDFVAGLLNPDPKLRLNPFTAILHPFLAEETPYRFTMSPRYLSELGSSLYDPLVAPPGCYDHAPRVADDLKARFLTSTDLLKFGTNPRITHSERELLPPFASPAPRLTSSSGDLTSPMPPLTSTASYLTASAPHLTSPAASGDESVDSLYSASLRRAKEEFIAEEEEERGRWVSSPAFGAKDAAEMRGAAPLRRRWKDDLDEDAIPGLAPFASRDDAAQAPKKKKSRTQLLQPEEEDPDVDDVLGVVRSVGAAKVAPRNEDRGAWMDEFRVMSNGATETTQATIIPPSTLLSPPSPPPRPPLPSEFQPRSSPHPCSYLASALSTSPIENDAILDSTKTTTTTTTMAPNSNYVGAEKQPERHLRLAPGDVEPEERDEKHDENILENNEDYDEDYDEHSFLLGDNLERARGKEAWAGKVERKASAIDKMADDDGEDDNSEIDYEKMAEEPEAGQAWGESRRTYDDLGRIYNESNGIPIKNIAAVSNSLSAQINDRWNENGTEDLQSDANCGIANGIGSPTEVENATAILEKFERDVVELNDDDADAERILASFRGEMTPEEDGVVAAAMENHDDVVWIEEEIVASKRKVTRSSDRGDNNNNNNSIMQALQTDAALLEYLRMPNESQIKFESENDKHRSDNDDKNMMSLFDASVERTSEKKEMEKEEEKEMKKMEEEMFGEKMGFSPEKEKKSEGETKRQEEERISAIELKRKSSECEICTTKEERTGGEKIVLGNEELAPEGEGNETGIEKVVRDVGSFASDEERRKDEIDNTSTEEEILASKGRDNVEGMTGINDEMKSNDNELNRDDQTPRRETMELFFHGATTEKSSLMPKNEAKASKIEPSTRTTNSSALVKNEANNFLEIENVAAPIKETPGTANIALAPPCGLFPIPSSSIENKEISSTPEVTTTSLSPPTTLQQKVVACNEEKTLTETKTNMATTETFVEMEMDFDARTDQGEVLNSAEPMAIDDSEGNDLSSAKMASELNSTRDENKLDHKSIHEVSGKSSQDGIGLDFAGETEMESENPSEMEIKLADSFTKREEEDEESREEGGFSAGVIGINRTEMVTLADTLLLSGQPIEPTGDKLGLSVLKSFTHDSDSLGIKADAIKVVREDAVIDNVDAMKTDFTEKLEIENEVDFTRETYASKAAKAASSSKRAKDAQDFVVAAAAKLASMESLQMAKTPTNATPSTVTPKTTPNTTTPSAATPTATPTATTPTTTLERKKKKKNKGRKSQKSTPSPENKPRPSDHRQMAKNTQQTNESDSQTKKINPQAGKSVTAAEKLNHIGEKSDLRGENLPDATSSHRSRDDDVGETKTKKETKQTKDVDDGGAGGVESVERGGDDDGAGNENKLGQRPLSKTEMTATAETNGSTNLTNEDVNNNNNKNNNFSSPNMNIDQLHVLIDDETASGKKRVWAAAELIRRQNEDVVNIRETNHRSRQSLREASTKSGDGETCERVTGGEDVNVREKMGESRKATSRESARMGVVEAVETAGGPLQGLSPAEHQDETDKSPVGRIDRWWRNTIKRRKRRKIGKEAEAEIEPEAGKEASRLPGDGGGASSESKRIDDVRLSPVKVDHEDISVAYSVEYGAGYVIGRSDQLGDDETEEKSKMAEKKDSSPGKKETGKQLNETGTIKKRSPFQRSYSMKLSRTTSPNKTTSTTTATTTSTTTTSTTTTAKPKTLSRGATLRASLRRLRRRNPPDASVAVAAGAEAPKDDEADDDDDDDSRGKDWQIGTAVRSLFKLLSFSLIAAGLAFLLGRF